MESGILVYIGLGYSSLPDGTKPEPAPMLVYRQTDTREYKSVKSETHYYAKIIITNLHSLALTGQPI